jgi:hypothetical protein
VTRFEEAADPERYPIPGDDFIQEMIAEGCTDEEAAEELCAKRSWTLTSAGRRVLLVRIAAIRAIAEHPEPRPGAAGPVPMVDRGTVERTRRHLEAAGLSCGERSIAKELGVSRSTVRYALGKDRRRPRLRLPTTLPTNRHLHLPPLGRVKPSHASDLRSAPRRRRRPAP